MSGPYIYRPISGVMIRAVPSDDGDPLCDYRTLLNKSQVRVGVDPERSDRPEFRAVRHARHGRRAHPHGARRPF
jgi:hypothetical protein